MSSPRAEQKLQTRQALMAAARSLMDGGRGFGSLSLREVTRLAGIVPTGFYRHFHDMDELGLALVAEVGETFRETLRAIRRNEFELGGMIEASASQSGMCGSDCTISIRRWTTRSTLPP